ncbi:MAG: DUF2927 domain-containing protein [Pseudomonadota bacterium]
MLLAACARPGIGNAELDTMWDDIAADGGMREDYAPADAPFSNDDLVRNFVRVAFFSEFSREDGAFVERRDEVALHRWQAPIRVLPVFGRGVAETRRAGDRADLADFVARLSRVTGHPMTMVEGNWADGDILVLFADAQGRRRFADTLEQLDPGIDPFLLEDLRGDLFGVPCAFYPFIDAGTSVISFAIVVIRDEMRQDIRYSCIHEEMAQVLGLGNDHPDVRPSIFNDDEEFILLTEHDEYLLRMLYDPALSPGITLEEARPLLRPIIDRLRPEGAE